MLISTFELLVKNILPAPAAPPASGIPLGRTVIQGYFLTIANTSGVSASFELKFTAESPSFQLGPDPDSDKGSGTTRLLAVFDSAGNDVFLPLPSVDKSRTLTFDLTIDSRDTALFILQPNVTKPALIAEAGLEIRGYSQISLKSAGGASSVNVLLTPEHRGTFLKPVSPEGTTPLPEEFDQLVYSLPTARGRSLYELTV